MDDQDWSEDGQPFIGHPVVATLCGRAVITLTAVFLPRMQDIPALPVLLGGGAALGLVLWLLGFALTIRRSPAMWKLGTLAVLVGAGLIGGFGANLLNNSQTQGDATSFAETELESDGTPTPPRDATARGPLSRLYVDHIQKSIAEKRALGQALGQLGVGAMSNPYDLQNAPGVLGHCGDIARLKATAESNRKAQGERLAALVTAIDHSKLGDDLKAGMKGMLAPGETPAALDAMLAADVEMIDSSTALCTLLAKKSWSFQGGYFGFNNGGDQVAYKAIEKRRGDAAAATTKLERDGKDRFTKARDTVRDILDVSGRH